MDLLLDENYELRTENGDFVTGDSFKQEEALLLITGQGEWKENPLAGVGLFNYLNDENPETMKAEIKRQFKADGKKVKSIEFTNNEIRIDAERS